MTGATNAGRKNLLEMKLSSISKLSKKKKVDKILTITNPYTYLLIVICLTWALSISNVSGSTWARLSQNIEMPLNMVKHFAHHFNRFVHTRTLFTMGIRIQICWGEQSILSSLAISFSFSLMAGELWKILESEDYLPSFV